MHGLEKDQVNDLVREDGFNHGKNNIRKTIAV